MDMGNLNLSDEQKQLLDSNDGYQKVFLGANLEGQYNIGDICTVSPYSENDAVVAGFLKKVLHGQREDVYLIIKQMVTVMCVIINLFY